MIEYSAYFGNWKKKIEEKNKYELMQKNRKK